MGVDGREALQHGVEVVIGRNFAAAEALGRVEEHVAGMQHDFAELRVVRREHDLPPREHQAYVRHELG